LEDTRDQDVGSLGERNVLNKIYNALVKKYNLSTSLVLYVFVHDKKEN